MHYVFFEAAVGPDGGVAVAGQRRMALWVGPRMAWAEAYQNLFFLIINTPKKLIEKKIKEYKLVKINNNCVHFTTN